MAAKVPKDKKINVNHIVTFGDSLSGRARFFNKKLLFNQLSTNAITGMNKISPLGRFTNGRVWIDDEAEKLEKRYHETLQKKENHDATKTVLPVVNLNDPREIKHHHSDFIRTYNEGGATADEYTDKFTTNLKLLATRKMITNLTQLRDEMLGDNEARGVTPEEKEKTLISEWIGANDLITVNERPTEEAAKKAVDARIKHLEILAEHGYKHFVSFNLPDLSLTPRYQRMSLKERLNAQKVSKYFNDRLTDQVTELQKKHPDCSFDIFDINAIFQDAYKHPQKYGFDPDKKKSPIIESKGFNFKAVNDKEHRDYIFWDDVHPSAAVHQLLSDKFDEFVSKKYNITPVEDSLLTKFKHSYGQKLLDSQRGLFGFFRNSRIDYKHAKLEDILRHALSEGGERTRQVITELGLINKNGGLAQTNQPELVKAWEHFKGANPTPELSHPDDEAVLSPAMRV